MIDWDAAVLAPCMGVFGEDQRPLYRRRAGGDPFPIDGIFDDAYLALLLNGDGDPEAVTIEPVMGVRRAQLPADPVKGDEVYVPRVNKTFLVVDKQPDGHGAVKLILSLKAP